MTHNVPLMHCSENYKMFKKLYYLFVPICICFLNQHSNDCFNKELYVNRSKKVAIIIAYSYQCSKRMVLHTVSVNSFNYIIIQKEKFGE